jgi:hypothetical protein
MAVITYPAIVRNGKIEPVTPLDLPDGSEVYVVAQVDIDARTARRKANGWLVDHVGNLVMADDGALVQKDERWIWRFNAYMTSPAHPPRGPIGQVELNATTGEILSDQHTITDMYERARHLTYPAQPAA